MRALMLNEISQVSGGNYTPSMLELSGAGSIFFGACGGVVGGIISLINPASVLTFQASASAIEITTTLPLPVMILMGIGLGASLGSLVGLGLYSVGVEISSSSDK